MKISPFSISLTHVPQFLRTQNFPSQLNWVKLKKKGYDNTDSNFEICYWFRGFFVAWNIESNFEICCLFEAFFIGAIRVEVGTYQNFPGKLRQQSAIYWNSPGLFRDYGLNYIFFRNKTLFVRQNKKLKFLASDWRKNSWNLT